MALGYSKTKVGGRGEKCTDRNRDRFPLAPGPMFVASETVIRGVKPVSATLWTNNVPTRSSFFLKWCLYSDM